MRFSAAVALAVSTSACLIPTRVQKLDPEIPREATPVAIEAALRAMDDPANKQRMLQMLASPEMKAVERELVSGLVDGSLASLNEADRAERLGALRSRYATGMLQDFTQGFTKDVVPQIGPVVSDVMRSAVRAAMSEAMKPENQLQLTSAISGAITRDLGPALQKVISDNLAPGIAAALQNDEVKRALGETAHLLGREIVLGVNDGMNQIQESRGKGESSMLGSLGNLANKSANVASVITWVLAALVLVLGAFLLKLLMQARKYRSESEEKNAETRLLTEARKASEGKPWSGELIAALEGRARTSERPSKARRRRPDGPSHVGQ
jgi:preprotein translocase subunit SecG